MLSVSFLAGRAIPMESGPASGAGPPALRCKVKIYKNKAEAQSIHILKISSIYQSGSSLDTDSSFHTGS